VDSVLTGCVWELSLYKLSPVEPALSLPNGDGSLARPSPGLSSLGYSQTVFQISFLRWFYRSMATTLHGSANPHFVIPSEAEGPAVRRDVKRRPYQ